MKRALTTLAIGAFFIWLTVYIASGNSPFIAAKIDEYGLYQIYLDQMDIIDNIDVLIEFGLLNKILDFKIVFVLLGIGLIAITITIAGFHMIIEKLFFKRYYEQPSTFIAIRRGFFIGITIVSNFLFNLVGASSWSNIALLLLLFISIELLVHKFFDQHKVENENGNKVFKNGWSIGQSIDDSEYGLIDNHIDENDSDGGYDEDSSSVVESRGDY